MIDIHSHILPAIDDGSQDIKESLAMARLYLDNGFSGVVATSHWMEESVDLEIYDRAFNLLQEKLKENAINLDLYKGHELYISLQLAEKLKAMEGYSVNKGPYALVELPMSERGNYFDSVLHNLQLKGYRPILAHPERYAYVISDPNLIVKWIERGFLIQMNISSLIGNYGNDVRKAADILLQHDMVHFLATDSHSSRRRSPNIVKELQGLVDQDKINFLLKDNPRRVLQGEDINVTQPRLYKKKKFFFF